MESTLEKTNKYRNKLKIIFGLSLLIIPIIEIYLFSYIGELIGLWGTLAWVIATAFVGGYLLKNSSTKIGWSAMTKELRGEESNGLEELEMLSALVVMMGGALVILPGLFTDIIGVFCYFKPIRMGVLKVIVTAEGKKEWPEKK
ncbi:MAG: FxsA family protein [Gammaproteobacteria bacterium]|nr:FxsA family protein [Gammaproteobacteria bacterium]